MNCYQKNAFVNHTIKWESLNPEILVVDEATGEVTAKELGSGTIRVTVTDDENGKEFIDEIVITVLDFLKGDMNKDGGNKYFGFCYNNRQIQEK